MLRGGGDPAAAPRPRLRHRRPVAAARRPAAQRADARAAPGRARRDAARGRPRARARRRSSASATTDRWPAPPPSDADVLKIMEFTVDGTGMADYLPLLEEELAILGEDRRAPQWHATDTRLPARSSSAPACRGLLMAHRLQQAGIPFVIIEKNADVGGTWLENTYPGCRVDNPNHNYSYSFAQRHDWPLHFSTQDVLARLLPALRRRVRAAPAHPVRHRGRVGDVVGSRRHVDRPGEARRR